jgi:FtsH-binding integral membrane protein
MANSSLYNTLFNQKKNKKGGGAGASDLMNILYEKKTFLIKVFANIIVQLGITYYVMEKTQTTTKSQSNMYLYLYLFGGIVIILLMALVPMHSWLKFLLFSLFSYLTGLLLSILKAQTKTSIINTALIGTISIFAVMFAIGMSLIAFGIKLGIKTCLLLFFGLTTLILLRLIFLFSNASSTMNKALTFFALILFSMYIIYDTNSILQRNYNGDFITASFDYYLDIINIFVNLVSVGNN